MLEVGLRHLLFEVTIGADEVKKYELNSQMSLQIRFEFYSFEEN